MAKPRSESMLMVRALREPREGEVPDAPNPMAAPERQPSDLERSIRDWGREASQVPVGVKPLKGGAMLTWRGRF